MKTVITIVERITWVILVGAFSLYAVYTYFHIRLDLLRKSVVSLSTRSNSFRERSAE
jgi:hypothetical protein